MFLVGRPNFVINRFGNRYTSDSEGIIEAKNEDEAQIFKAYGFVEPKTEEPKTEEPKTSKK